MDAIRGIIGLVVLALFMGAGWLLWDMSHTETGMTVFLTGCLLSAAIGVFSLLANLFAKVVWWAFH